MKSGLGETLLGNTVVINHPAQFLPDLKFTLDSLQNETFADLIKYSSFKDTELKLK